MGRQNQIFNAETRFISNVACTSTKRQMQCSIDFWKLLVSLPIQVTYRVLRPCRVVRVWHDRIGFQRRTANWSLQTVVADIGRAWALLGACNGCARTRYAAMRDLPGGGGNQKIGSIWYDICCGTWVCRLVVCWIGLEWTGRDWFTVYSRKID